jgi:hypothetical protein
MQSTALQWFPDKIRAEEIAGRGPFRRHRWSGGMSGWTFQQSGQRLTVQLQCVPEDIGTDIVGCRIHETADQDLLEVDEDTPLTTVAVTIKSQDEQDRLKLILWYIRQNPVLRHLTRQQDLGRRRLIFLCSLACSATSESRT